ncbi:hypothetical protein Tco_0871709 [Tanacetum coccineum]
MSSLLKIFVAQNPKLYHATSLSDKKVRVFIHDSEDTLKNAEKSRLKMKLKQTNEEVQKMKIKPIDYMSLNNPYEKFVSQKVISEEQTYFSKESTSNVTHEKENSFQREFTKEVKEMFESFKSIENELAETSQTNANFNEEFDRLLKSSLVNDVKNYVMHSCVEIENENLRKDIERISKEFKDVQESLLKLRKLDDANVSLVFQVESLMRHDTFRDPAARLDELVIFDLKFAGSSHPSE